MNRGKLSESAKAEAQAKIDHNLARPALVNSPNKTVNVVGGSPWNPSISSSYRVQGNMEIPEICPCCGTGEVLCVPHSVIYGGRSFGDWPWALACSKCGATVGFHPFTNIPLGTLADKATRDARMLAKKAFNEIWQSGLMTRTEAYQWLSVAMCLPKEKTHIGMMDVTQCVKCEALSKWMMWQRTPFK